MSKSPDAFSAADQVGAVGIAVRMRPVGGADAFGRVAAQRHEALHAHRRELGDRPGRPRRGWRRCRSSARPASASIRSGCGAPCGRCARASSRRRRRSPRRNAASSGCSLVTVSHSRASISSVFGGKNSKETRTLSPICGTARKAELRHQAVSLAVGLMRRIGDQQRGGRGRARASRSAPRSAPARGSNCWRVLEIEAGLREPFGDLLVGEAEAHMRMLLAQEFQPVRGEVDDQQPAGGPQQCVPPRGSPLAGRRDSAAPDAW